MSLLSYTVSILIIWFVYFLFSVRNKLSLYNLKDLKNFVTFNLITEKIKKFKEKHKKLIKNLDVQFKNEINVRGEKDSECHYFYGLDQKENNLTLKFDLNKSSIAIIHIFLRIKENIYTLPGKNACLVTSLPKNRWKADGLNIEVLEPFKKFRITYNGLLQNSSFGGEIQHVQFNFIFTAVCSPSYIPNDVDDFLIAKFLSKSKIRIAKDELNMQYGFEQLGVLKGFVKINNSDEVILNLPTNRSRYRGIDNAFTCNRIFKILSVDECGNLFNIIIKWFKDNFAQLEYGFVYLSNEKHFPISNIDLLQFDNKNDSLLNIKIKVNGKIYRMCYNLKNDLTLKSLNDHTFGYQICNIPANCKINDFSGKAIVEYWYEYKGLADVIPEPKLSEKIVKNLPETIVCDIKDKESQIVALTGGKGCSLGLLTSLQSSLFSVPHGFVITIKAYTLHLQENPSLVNSISFLNDICCGKIDDNLEQACEKTMQYFKTKDISQNLKEKIIIQLQKYPKDDFHSWAVRSSAIGEDSEDLSAAGQNETFLGCRTNDQIFHSIQACWASLYSYQSVQYRWQHGLPVITEMAVVVQKMVSAESAGVLFTCHPSTNDPSQMVVTSTFGLGETVVSGKSDPDTFILQRSWNNQISIQQKMLGKKNNVLKMTNDGLMETSQTEYAVIYSLTDKQIMELGNVGTFLEKAFGNPRDIEWGFYKGQLYLFQSRPITTLNAWTDFELSHELDSPILSDNFVSTTANIREVVPKAVTVLTRTTSLKCLDWALQKYTKKNFDPVTLRGLVTYQHNVFLDVCTTIHLHATTEIQLSDITLDLAIFGHPVLDKKINQIIKNRLGLSSTLKKLSEVYTTLPTAWKYRQHFEQARNVVKNMNLVAVTSEELYKKIDATLEDVEKLCILHSKTTRSSVFYQICTMNVLLERNKEILTEHISDFALILSSCEDVISAEVPHYLEEISNILKQAGYSDEFRGIKPSQGVDWLKNNCTKAYELYSEFLEKHGHRSLAEFEIFEESWSDNPSKIIDMIQANVGNERKEKHKMDIDEVIGNLKSPKIFITRHIVKFLMKRIRVAVGVREHTKSLLIKGIDMLRKAYRELGDKMVEKGLIPSRNLIFHLTHYEIGLILKDRNPNLVAKAIRRQKLYSNWKNITFPEIMFGIPEADDESSSIPLVIPKEICKGTPVCRGIAQARACVIRNLDEIHQLKSGDILITYSTDIGWSPYFPMLSGVVTELGGLVSHGAVVAREYGLPCVVGVKNVLKRFKTGDIVQLNANNGELGIV